jgi:uncharacterized protein (DUF1778 family)
MRISRLLKSFRLGVHLNAHQQSIVIQAAALKNQTPKDFIMSSALTEAEKTLFDHNLFIIDKKSFDSFQRVLNEPAKVDKRLLKLLSEPNPW